MCTRNRISPPKSVHKSHIEMTKTLWYTTLEYTLPLFVTNRQRGQREKRVRNECMNSDNNAGGKNEKFLKTTLKITLNMENTWFLRLSQVARVSRETLWKQDSWKIFYVFFVTGKTYSRGSCKLSRENLCVPFVTRPSTCKQVAKTDPWAHDCGMRLVWLVTESPK